MAIRAPDGANKGRLGSSAKTAKKNPFSLNFPPQSRRQHFLRKIYLQQICSSPCPQGRQQSTAVAADPQSPHPLPPPHPHYSPTCLNPILPLPPSRYHPKVLATEPPSFMVVKYRGPDSHAKGRFPGIYASNVSCWHHSAGTHRKG